MRAKVSGLTLIVFVVIALSVVTSPAVAQSGGSVDNIQVSLSDSDGDGLDDSIVVDVQVTDDGTATVVEFDGPFSLNLSETDEDQGLVTVVGDDQENENVTFGSTGYTGTYTVRGTLSGQTAGDVGSVTAWVGATNRAEADDIISTNFTVSASGTSSDRVNISVPSTVQPNSTFQAEVRVNETAVTAMEFDAPFSVNLSGTDSRQAPVVVVNDEQERENVSFGGASYTGTYTVTVEMEGGTEGDVIDVRSWIGSPYRDEADAETTESIEVRTVARVDWCPESANRRACGALADGNGEPVDGIELLGVLGKWDRTGEINGEPVSDLRLLELLGSWDNAR